MRRPNGECSEGEHRQSSLENKKRNKVTQGITIVSFQLEKTRELHQGQPSRNEEKYLKKKTKRKKREIEEEEKEGEITKVRRRKKGKKKTAEK